jgi:hypothetical protein
MSDLRAAVDPLGRAFVAWRERQGTARRILVAQAPVGGSFRITTLGRGQALGAPVITARPDGGAAIAWPAAEGWQGATAAKGTFGRVAKISSALSRGDLDTAQGSLATGPGTRVELVWRQLGDLEPTTGPVVWQSSDVGAP